MKMVPIAVFMPCHSIQKSCWSGSFPIPEETPQSLHIIGFLAGMETEEGSRSFEERKKELAAHGVELSLYLAPSRNGDGEVGCGVFHGVEVAGIEQAKALPGFAVCGMWSGYQFIAPALDKSTLLRFGGNVEEHRMPEGTKPPKCCDGVRVESMIPRGEIAEMVFFEDMPDRVFVVRGMAVAGNAGVETARAFRGG